MSPLSAQVRQAVTALMQCHAAAGASCNLVLESGARGGPQHVRLLADVAAITLATADALLRKSQFQSQFAPLCIAICDTCAEGCGRLEAMADCAAACRQAAAACSALDAPEKAQILAMASRLPPS